MTEKGSVASGCSIAALCWALPPSRLLHLAHFSSTFVAEPSFLLWNFRNDKVTSSHNCPSVTSYPRLSVKWSACVASHETISSSVQNHEDDGKQVCWAFQEVWRGGAGRGCWLRATNLLNWEKDGGVAIQRNRNDLWWMWDDDVALCERRRCPLSQSTGKLRGAGAPHGWVGGQGATHCVGLTGGPWVNTASRRRLGGWGCTGRPPTQAINLIREIFLRFVSMQQRNWSVGGDVSLADVILAKMHLNTANSLLHFLVNNLRASLSSWWNSPTFTSSACFTFQKEISPLWCHKDHKHPTGSLPGLFLAPSKSAEGPTKQPFLFLFWRGDRYYHKIIHKINHEIPLLRSPRLKTRSEGRVLCSRHTVNLEVGHMQMRWSRQFAWGPVLPTPPLHEP